MVLASTPEIAGEVPLELPRPPTSSHRPFETTCRTLLGPSRGTLRPKHRFPQIFCLKGSCMGSWDPTANWQMPLGMRGEPRNLEGGGACPAHYRGQRVGGSQGP